MYPPAASVTAVGSVGSATPLPFRSRYTPHPASPGSVNAPAGVRSRTPFRLRSFQTVPRTEPFSTVKLAKSPAVVASPANTATVCRLSYPGDTSHPAGSTSVTS